MRWPLRVRERNWARGFVSSALDGRYLTTHRAECSSSAIKALPCVTWARPSLPYASGTAVLVALSVGRCRAGAMGRRRVSSAILYLAIVAIWAGVLIPRWLKRDTSRAKAAKS